MPLCNLPAGNDFPTGIGRHTSLYYKDSFLVLGGLGGHDCLPAECADTSTTGNCALLPIVAGYDAALVGTVCRDDGAVRVVIQLHFCTAQCTSERYAGSQFEKDTCVNHMFQRHLQY